MPATWLTADTLLTELPANLHGLVLLTSSDGGDVTIYDGRDTSSGTKIGVFEGIADDSQPISFVPPILCDQGIYVDVGSSVTGVLIHWSLAR